MLFCVYVTREGIVEWQRTNIPADSVTRTMSELGRDYPDSVIHCTLQRRQH
jgi:hypothetical protein